MKILAVETHYKIPFKGGIRTSAVDWWRIVNPFTHLKKNTDWVVDITKGVPDADGKIDDLKTQEAWLRIAREYDVVVFSYMENGLAFSILEVLSQKYGLKYLLDLDDNLISISDYNPVKEKYLKDPKRYQDLLTILKNASHLSVTNGYLKDVYANFRNKKDDFIKILPNYIDLNVYKADEKKKHERIIIGYQGSSTHYGDLIFSEFLPAISYILGKYKNVEFSIVGVIPTMLNDLPRVKYRVGTPDFYQWIKIWREWIREVDIGVAPLEESEFNRCRSSIKFFEYSAGKIPTVASSFYKSPYELIVDGKTGFKAKTIKDWIKALEFLIEREDKRKEIGENAYNLVKKNYNIETKWQLWKETILQLKK